VLIPYLLSKGVRTNDAGQTAFEFAKASGRTFTIRPQKL